MVFMIRRLQGVVYYFGFKPNLTVAGMKPYFDRLIEIHDLHPADLYAANRYIESYMKHPPLKI